MDLRTQKSIPRAEPGSDCETTDDWLVCAGRSMGAPLETHMKAIHLALLGVIVALSTGVAAEDPPAQARPRRPAQEGGGTPKAGAPTPETPLDDLITALKDPSTLKRRNAASDI